MQGTASTPSCDFNRTDGIMMLGAKRAVLVSLRNQNIAEVFREEMSPSRTESNVETKVLPNYP